MRIHAIIIALNEEDYIAETIKALYPFCSGISVVTQYDRDYYGRMVAPDKTVERVLQFRDVEGKIHLVMRRYNDETASRNHEMKSVLFDASRGIRSHGVPHNRIQAFHAPPDYFLICDADGIYDPASLPAILEYLASKKPKGMRVSAYDYIGTWNRRIPRTKYVHHHFGFVKAGLLFEQRRVLTWNESRINTLSKKLGMQRKLGSAWYGFIDCPWEVGMFHHGGYVRKDKQQLREKMRKHSHMEAHPPEFLERILSQEMEYVETSMLPLNIQQGTWPASFFE